MTVLSWLFDLSHDVFPPECALFVPYSRKIIVPCALQCALLLMPGGVRWAVQAGESCGRSGRGCCTCLAVSAGAFPSQGRGQRVPICLLVRGGGCSRRNVGKGSSVGRKKFPFFVPPPEKHDIIKPLGHDEFLLISDSVALLLPACCSYQLAGAFCFWGCSG